MSIKKDYGGGSQWRGKEKILEGEEEYIYIHTHTHI
jgi:hypothetical protein